MKRQTIGFVATALGLPIGLAVVLRSDAPFFYVLPFTLAGVLILGPSAFRFFVSRQWLSIWHFLAGGLALGAVCTIVFLPERLFQCLKWALLFGPAGAISAALFWVLAVWRNKQLIQKKNKALLHE